MLAEASALTLVFVETKRGASDLAYYLQKDGYNVVAIHGDLKQFEREKHLETFRSGVAPILVATAVGLPSSVGYNCVFLIPVALIKMPAVFEIGASQFYFMSIIFDAKGKET